MRGKISCFFFLITLLLAGCAENITESREDNRERRMPTFIQTAVFNSNCAFNNCHGGTQSPNLTADVAYANIVNKSGPNSDFSYITPGKPSESYLFMKITGDARITGSRMPRNAPALSAALIDSVRIWIENGAEPRYLSN